jgi:hypothetical protein
VENAADDLGVESVLAILEDCDLSSAAIAAIRSGINPALITPKNGEAPDGSVS